jgi:cell wall-associated NlpC family hydrolase
MAAHRQVPRHRGGHASAVRRALPVASVGTAAAAVLGLAPGVGHAAPAPADARQAAEQRIAALYRQAEEATEQYDAQQERIARLQAALDAVSGESAAERELLSTLVGGLGRLAAQQYREPAYGSTYALLFATHPDDYLEKAGLGNRLATFDAQQIGQAQRARQQLTTLAALGEQEVQQLQAARTRLADERASIESELGQARGTLDALDGTDRRAVSDALSRDWAGEGFGTDSAVQAPSLAGLLAAMAGAGGTGYDEARAQKAIEAAYAELGKPYEWGAVGPDGFDCSGLMQHAWGEAGVMLPRTSQEQADAGQSVPLSEIEPGDLVIYFAGRTHVGMYVGDGLVIHAPHPGAPVRFAPVGSMPIDKVVRPYGG